jgi:cell division protein FtsB
MQDKIKNYQKQLYNFALQLRDVRFAGLMLFVVIVLLISWSGVKSIQTNYELQKQISALRQRNQIQKLQDKNLKLQNEYYNTNQYLELSARQNFGLAAPGETELIVPKSVALAHTVGPPASTAKDDKPSAKQPAYQRHFEAWVDFFLHRQQDTD